MHLNLSIFTSVTSFWFVTSSLYNPVAFLLFHFPARQLFHFSTSVLSYFPLPSLPNFSYFNFLIFTFLFFIFYVFAPPLFHFLLPYFQFYVFYFSLFTSGTAVLSHSSISYFYTIVPLPAFLTFHFLLPHWFTFELPHLSTSSIFIRFSFLNTLVCVDLFTYQSSLCYFFIVSISDYHFFYFSIPHCFYSAGRNLISIDYLWPASAKVESVHIPGNAVPINRLMLEEPGKVK